MDTEKDVDNQACLEACDPCFIQLIQSNQADVVWGVWYERDRPFLLNYVQKRLKGELAEDIVQEAFATAFVNIQNGRFTYTGSPLRAYLTGIAKNLIWENFRKTKREFGELLETYQIESNAMTLEQQTMVQETFEFLESALRNLKPQQKEILRLTYMEGKKSAEVAEICELTRENVRITAMRGVQKIQQSLDSRFGVALSAAGVRVGLEGLVVLNG